MNVNYIDLKKAKTLYNKFLHADRQMNVNSSSADDNEILHTEVTADIIDAMKNLHQFYSEYYNANGRRNNSSNINAEFALLECFLIAIQCKDFSEVDMIILGLWLKSEYNAWNVGYERPIYLMPLVEKIRAEAYCEASISNYNTVISITKIWLKSFWNKISIQTMELK